MMVEEKLNINRREFFAAMASLGVCALLPGHAFADAPLKVAPKTRLLVGRGNILCVFHSHTWKLLNLITLDFFPHAFIPVPRKPDRVWTVQRHNYDLSIAPKLSMKRMPYVSKAVEVDIISGEITRTVTAKEGSVFRGHALFYKGVIFISRVDMESGKGYLTGYDPADGKQVADYNVTRAGLHECVLAKDGTAFMASTGTREISPYSADRTQERLDKGGVIQFDLTSGKKLDHIPIEHEEQGLGHLCLHDDGRIIAIAQTGYNKPIVPLVYMGKSSEATLKPVPYNATVPSGGKAGELFSVCLNEKENMALVSSLANNSIILVDTHKRKLVGSVPFIEPWGIALDGKGRFVVSGVEYIGTTDTALSSLDKADLSDQLYSSRFGSGHSLIV